MSARSSAGSADFRYAPGSGPEAGEATSRQAAASAKQRSRSDARQVHRQEDRDVVTRRPEPGDHARERRAHVRPVVGERKRQLETVGDLPHGDSLVARLAEHAPRALRKRLAVETGERLRRAEAPARAADEQNAGQPVIRHASV